MYRYKTSQLHLKCWHGTGLNPLQEKLQLTATILNATNSWIHLQLLSAGKVDDAVDIISWIKKKCQLLICQKDFTLGFINKTIRQISWNEN